MGTDAATMMIMVSAFKYKVVNSVKKALNSGVAQLLERYR